LEFNEAILAYTEQPLTKQILLDVLKDYSRPFDKIHELTRQEFLIPLKRGIFLPGPRLKMPMPESFLISNHLWGPSYVSLESAMSYWGLIPERVYETTAVTTKLVKKYSTSIGRFSYTKLPLPYYAMGIKQVALTPRQHILIASPEKAICDKIITTSGILLRSKKQTLEFLIEDLRIDETDLKKLDTQDIAEWIPYAQKRTSLEMLVSTIESLKSM
jgi:hypothetical protein